MQARLTLFRDEQNIIYTPIIDGDGRPLGPREVASLAAAPAEWLYSSVRRFKATLLTEDPLPDGTRCSLSDGFFFVRSECPVVFGGDDYIVGVVEAVTNLTDGLEWYTPVVNDGSVYDPIICDPVVVAKDGTIIATLNGVPSGADFRVLVTIRLHNTELAAILWDGIRRGLIDSVCGAFTVFVDENDRATRGVLDRVRIQGLGSNCLPAARIFHAWEEEQPALEVQVTGAN